ncbi:unnamed protein product [Chrysoparadoxa australica]
MWTHSTTARARILLFEHFFCSCLALGAMGVFNPIQAYADFQRSPDSGRSDELWCYYFAADLIGVIGTALVCFASLCFVDRPFRYGKGFWHLIFSGSASASTCPVPGVGDEEGHLCYSDWQNWWHFYLPKIGITLGMAVLGVIHSCLEWWADLFDDSPGTLERAGYSEGWHDWRIKTYVVIGLCIWVLHIICAMTSALMANRSFKMLPVIPYAFTRQAQLGVYIYAFISYFMLMVLALRGTALYYEGHDMYQSYLSQDSASFHACWISGLEAAGISTVWAIFFSAADDGAICFLQEKAWWWTTANVMKSAVTHKTMIKDIRMSSFLFVVVLIMLFLYLPAFQTWEARSKNYAEREAMLDKSRPSALKCGAKKSGNSGTNKLATPAHEGDTRDLDRSMFCVETALWLCRRSDDAYKNVGFEKLMKEDFDTFGNREEKLKELASQDPKEKKDMRLASSDEFKGMFEEKTKSDLKQMEDSKDISAAVRQAYEKMTASGAYKHKMRRHYLKSNGLKPGGGNQLDLKDHMLCQKIYDAPTDTHVIIMRHSKTKRLVVSFRGTASMSNAKTDFDFGMTALDPGSFRTVQEAAKRRARVNCHQPMEEWLESEPKLDENGKTVGRKWPKPDWAETEKPQWTEQKYKLWSDLLDALSNPKKGNPDRIGNMRVHNGFRKAYNTVRKEVLLCLASELVKEPADIYFTGHSLGGALATLAAYDTTRNLLIPFQENEGGKLIFTELFMEREAPVISELWTFGSPRVGNYWFSRRVELMVPYIWRVAGQGDPVTQGPPLLSLFRHCGKQVLIDPRAPTDTDSGVPSPQAEEKGSDVFVTPGFLDYLVGMAQVSPESHKMQATYLPALEQALQETTRGTQNTYFAEEANTICGRYGFFTSVVTLPAKDGSPVKTREDWDYGQTLSHITGVIVRLGLYYCATLFATCLVRIAFDGLVLVLLLLARYPLQSLFSMALVAKILESLS